MITHHFLYDFLASADSSYTSFHFFVVKLKACACFFDIEIYAVHRVLIISENEASAYVIFEDLGGVAEYSIVFVDGDVECVATLL